MLKTGATSLKDIRDRRGDSQCDATLLVMKGPVEAMLEQHDIDPFVNLISQAVQKNKNRSSSSIRG